MDNKKKILIIVISVIVLMLLIFVLWLIFRGKPESGNVNVDTGKPLSLEEQLSKLPPSAKTEEDKNYPLSLKQLAFSFTERFGSYSTDAGFKNYDDLKLVATSRMKQELANLSKTNTGQATGYEGFETKALSSRLINLKDNRAEVTVTGQRTRYTSTGNPSIFYQDLKLVMVKEGQEWKIDEARWQ